MKLKSKKLGIVLGLILLLTVIVKVTEIYVPFVQTQAAAKNNSAIKLSKQELTVGVGRNSQLEVTGTSNTVDWKSSDSAIATVTKNGMVQGKKAGSVKVTATVGGNTYQCKVTVKTIVVQDVMMREYDAMFEGGEKDLYSAYNAWQSYDMISLNLSQVQKTYSKYGYDNKGIYAAFYSPVQTTVEAFDKNGKSVGIVSDKNNFYAEFPNATELVITNVKNNLAIYFYPVAPTKITGAGIYTYEDLSWDELPKGNKRAYYLYNYKNSFWDLKLGTEAISNVYNQGTSLSMHTYADASSIPMGISDFWVCGYFSSDSKDKAEKISDFTLIAGESYIYNDDKALFLYGKEGLEISNNYIKELKNMLRVMKKVGAAGYVKDTKALAKKMNISIFDTHPSSSYPNVFLNNSVIDTSDLENLRVHLHEMAHYYDSINYHYGFLVDTWVEGFAEAYSEDALKELGEIDSNYLHADYDFADYKNSGMKFEQYFLSLDNYHNDEYAVGYHFIRYIQRKYGDDVIAKINASIVELIDKPTDIDQDESTDTKFIRCITSNTSKKVFSDFEKDVIN